MLGDFASHLPEASDAPRTLWERNDFFLEKFSETEVSAQTWVTNLLCDLGQATAFSVL